MALLQLVGFETGDGSELAALGAGCSISSTWSHSGTYSHRWTNTGGYSRIEKHGANGKFAVFGESELFVSFYFYLAANGGEFTWADILRIGNTGISNLCVSLQFDPPSGGMRISGATTSSAASPTLTVGNVYRVDIHAVQNGTCSLSINGGTAVTCTGNDQVIDNVSFGSGSGFGATYDWYYDDFWIDDAAFQTDDYLISVAVPTGNSAANTGWTASAGNKWECIDEIPPTNTEEITSGTGAGEIRYSATHASAATLGITGDILGVKVVARMSEVSSTTTSGAIGIRSGTTNFVTTNVDIGNTADVTMAVIHGVDPNTTAAWTESAFDAAEPLVRRASGDTSNIACSALYLMVAWVEQTLFESTSALTLPFPIMTAAGSQVNQATSALILPFPIMTSDGDQVMQATSSLVLPFPVLTATGIYTPATREGTASLILPFPIITASGQQIEIASSGFILPFPILTASGTHTDIQGNASLVLPFPIMEASGLQIISGSAGLVLPFPVLTSTGLEVYLSSAELILPFPIFSASGYKAYVGSGEFILPFPILTASGQQYVFGDAELTLPFPILTVTGFLILPHEHLQLLILQLPDYNNILQIPDYTSILKIEKSDIAQSIPKLSKTLNIPKFNSSGDIHGSRN